MKLFDAVASTSFEGGEVRVEQLASMIDADPLLVGEIRSLTYKLQHHLTNDKLASCAS